MSSGRIEAVYELVVETKPERLMLCHQALFFYPRTLLGIVTMPRIDRDQGDGFIMVDRGTDARLAEPLRRFLAALVEVGLATGWYLVRLEVDGDETMLEVYPPKSNDEGNDVFAE